jgi:hypothetical protein
LTVPALPPFLKKIDLYTTYKFVCCSNGGEKMRYEKKEDAPGPVVANVDLVTRMRDYLTTKDPKMRESNDLIVESGYDNMAERIPYRSPNTE